MSEKVKSKRLAEEYANENYHYDAGYMFLRDAFRSGFLKAVELIEKKQLIKVETNLPTEWKDGFSDGWHAFQDEVMIELKD